MPLTPSSRLLIRKKLVEKLMFDEWPLIDATLREFGLPNKSWDGDKSGYVLEMAKGASDKILAEIGKFLTSPEEEIIQADLIAPPSPSFWGSGFRLFVSHLASQRAFAGSLKKSLENFGISAFVAHDDIEPTTEWQVQIELALASCDGLIALLHPDFHKSNWTDQEIGFAMGRGVPTYAVRLGETPYGFIGRFQAFNGNGKSAYNISKELFESLLKNPKTRDRMAEGAVTAFERSNSYATAKERMGYLEKLEVWNDSFNDRLEAAAEANSQIRDAIGVPQRVKSLISSHLPF